MESSIDLAAYLPALLMGCFLIFITSFFAWQWGFYQIPKNEAEGSLSLKDVLIPFAFFLGLSAFILPLLILFARYLYEGAFDYHSNTTLILVSNISLMLTFLAIIIFLSFATPQKRALILGKYFGPTTSLKKTLNDIALGILTWFISFPIVLMAGTLVSMFFHYLGLEAPLNQVAVSQVKETLSSRPLFLMMAATVTFFVPVIEEFLFRGCLQTWIRGKMGVKKAILITSFIFASFHFSFIQDLGNVELLISLFILSCFLGLIYEKQQSLLASISLHSFFNSITILMIMNT